VDAIYQQQLHLMKVFGLSEGRIHGVPLATFGKQMATATGL
jgi:hypothetical protein